MKMTGVNRTCTLLPEGDQDNPRSKHPTAPLVVCYSPSQSKFQPCSSIPSLLSWVHPPQPGHLLVEEVAAREFTCRLHGVPANGTVVIVHCQLLWCCNCKSTKKKREETEGMTTQAQHGLLSTESSTEKTLLSMLTFH